MIRKWFKILKNTVLYPKKSLSTDIHSFLHKGNIKSTMERCHWNKWVLMGEPLRIMFDIVYARKS